MISMKAIKRRASKASLKQRNPRTPSLSNTVDNQNRHQERLARRLLFGVPPQTPDDGSLIKEKPVSQLITTIHNLQARQNKPCFCIKVQDAYAGQGTSFLREGPIDASRLVALTLTSSIVRSASQQQLADAVSNMVAPDLDDLKVYRSGLSFENNERKMYVFLEATKSLRHVTLSWSFAYKDGLRKYLQSDAAKNLVSLRLEASGTSKITNELWRGLCGEEHNLPELQQLTLRNLKGLTPKALLCMLQIRHARGCTRPLLVEWEGCAIPPNIVNTARGLDIDMVEY